MINAEFKYVETDTLLAHEEVNPWRVNEHYDLFRKKGVRMFPVIFDRGSRIILDGHHRVAFAEAMGYVRVPAILVNYMSHDIVLRWRRPEFEDLDKYDVLKAVWTGKIFPPKTTKHYLIVDGVETRFDDVAWGTLIHGSQ